MASLVGKTLKNRYRVDEFLGSGGMADVYKVWDIRRGVPLAIKVMKEELAQDLEFLDRFRREASKLKKLQHPHIVRFYRLEQAGRLAFMVMDYIDRGTLRNEIFDKKAPLSIKRIIKIMRSVCSALHFAHQNDMVHSDVKPANIMIDSGREVFLSDFGIARYAETSTTTMVGFGALAYMAPEQIKGEAPTPRWDIYSLGIVLYEMLTGGKRPFTGKLAKTTGTDSQKVRWEQLNLAPPSPRRFNPRIRPELEAVVMKCLEKDPRRRFSTAMTLLNALRLALGIDEEEPEKHETIIEKITRWIQHVLNKIPWEYIRQKPWLLAIPLVIVVGIIIWPIIPPTKPLIPTEPVATMTTKPSPVPTNTPSPSYLPPDCNSAGRIWISANDGMTLVCVPAGKFIMGAHPDNPFARADEQPETSVYLDAFWIDQYEVTNELFAHFIEETGYVTTAEKDGGRVLDMQKQDWYIVEGADWQHPFGPNSNISATMDHPVVQISWHEATAYCEWAGRQLPSEAQWEKAARGTNKRMFNWEESKNYRMCVDANFAGYELRNLTWAKVGCKDNYKYTAPAIYPHYFDAESPYGAYNMIGNAQEWMLDDYDKNFYVSMYPSNPLNITDSDLKSLRGGSWASAVESMRYARREYDRAEKAYDTTGFRCVYIPE